MKTYICGICGFGYAEAPGDPAHGIAPGLKWEDVPEDWVCPVCGADKSMFHASAGEGARPEAAAALGSSTRGPMEDSVLCSSLAKACQKQYRAEEEALFTQLADWFLGQAAPAGGLAEVAAGVREDIAAYPAAMEAARSASDRGALRALGWGEKVTKIQDNLLRKAAGGAKNALPGRGFVCEACGFIFAGGAAPDMCPVCKVPAFKFQEVKKGA
ncbi:MAG TPA: rubredoxin [Candidatus Limnocylindria bacterium]|nr:rubredoxin [Candidatus Limnocylindria bacterium]